MLELVTLSFILPSPSPCIDLRVEISGINGNDCVRYFERRREEFRKLKGNIYCKTPRLIKYSSRV
jgi:hypothetical protein